MRIAEAWEAHGADLGAALTFEARREALGEWQSAIAKAAHGYADLVAGHPARDRVMRAQAEAACEAWLCGYMARKGWVEEAQALGYVPDIGRGLRDRVRALGVPIDKAGASVPTAIDQALHRVVAKGAAAAV